MRVNLSREGQREYLEKKKRLFLTHLPLKEYTGLIRKMPVSCSRFSKQVVSCSASRSRSLAYLSILSPHRSARLFCKLSILSRVENTPSSRTPPCFKLRSMKKKKKKKIKTRHPEKRLFYTRMFDVYIEPLYSVWFIKSLFSGCRVFIFFFFFFFS